MERQAVTKTAQHERPLPGPVPRQPVQEVSPEHNLRFLQRSLGNRGLGLFLQTKLTVGSHGDYYEQHADRVADHVMPQPRGTSSAGHAQPASDCPAAAPARLGGFLSSNHGQPLPDSLRDSAERELRHSFDGVRLHLGSEANQMAGAVSARAFTHGDDVVFRAGEFRPETPAGRQLLWHELGHVASHERIGSRVLRAPRYDTAPQRIGPPPPGSTPKSLHDQVDLKTKKTPPDIASAKVAGVTPGSDAETFLWNILFYLGQSDRWDTFVRLETAIGWAPPAPAGKTGGGTVIPLGEVNVSIDDKGNATAELIHSGPAATVTAGKSGAAAIAQIISNFQVHSVAKGDKDWGEPGFTHDVSDVLDSFQLLPASNTSALKGLDLLRFATLPKEHSGEFNPGGGVAMGATKVTAPPTLKLADNAFVFKYQTGPAGNFVSERVGGAANPTPASFQTILHESGHAVEHQDERPSKEALDQAIIGQNLTSNRLNAAIASAKAGAATPAAASLNAEAVQKRKSYDAAVALVKKDKHALNTKHVSATVIKGLSALTTTKKSTAHSAKATADASAKAFGSQEATESSAYRLAVDATTAALAQYESRSQSGDLEDLDDTLLAAFDARDKERKNLQTASSSNPALATFAIVETTQNEWEDALRTLAHTRGRSLRLDKFVTRVNSSSITPFTTYARKNWPYKPEEFYAEAYSLWLTDPEFLQKEYKPIFDLFDSGDYEK